MNKKYLVSDLDFLISQYEFVINQLQFFRYYSLSETLLCHLNELYKIKRSIESEVRKNNDE